MVTCMFTCMRIIIHVYCRVMFIMCVDIKKPGMLILILVLKDSLRTFFKSLSLSWSLGVRSSSLSWSLGSGPCPCPGPGGSGPCPYPGPCGLVLVLAFSPCKDLFPLFYYSDLFTYYCSVNAYN